MGSNEPEKNGNRGRPPCVGRSRDRGFAAAGFFCLVRQTLLYSAHLVVSRPVSHFEQNSVFLQRNNVLMFGNLPLGVEEETVAPHYYHMLCVM